MKEQGKQEVPQSPAFGKSLGGRVRSRLGAINKDIEVLKEKQQSIAFATLGEVINSWLLGEIKFVTAGDVTIAGEPEKTFEMCKGDGLTINELKGLQEKDLEETLPALQNTVADLVYLLLKNAIVIEELTYTPPGFTTVESILDLDDIPRRFPEVEWLPEMVGKPTYSVAAAIVVVDAVVLVLDYARTKA